jgi:predicted alpha/beta hydrolase
VVVSGSAPGVDQVFFGRFSAMPNEKGHRVVPLLLRGQATFPVAPLQSGLSSP